MWGSRNMQLAASLDAQNQPIPGAMSFVRSTLRTNRELCEYINQHLPGTVQCDGASAHSPFVLELAQLCDLLRQTNDGASYMRQQRNLEATLQQQRLRHNRRAASNQLLPSLTEPFLALSNLGNIPGVTSPLWLVDFRQLAREQVVRLRVGGGGMHTLPHVSELLVLYQQQVNPHPSFSTATTRRGKIHGSTTCSLCSRTPLCPPCRIGITQILH